MDIINKIIEILEKSIGIIITIFLLAISAIGIYAIYDFAGYNPKSLSALLNSTFMTNYMTIKFKEKHLAGGYLAINKNTLEKLPLVDIPQEIQDTLAQYYDEIVKRKVEGLDITSQLAQIDEIVDTLFENSED